MPHDHSESIRQDNPTVRDAAWYDALPEFGAREYSDVPLPTDLPARRARARAIRESRLLVLGMPRDADLPEPEQSP